MTSRRRWLALASVQALGVVSAWPARAQRPVPSRLEFDERWQLPARLARPDASSDEGGLWATMDRAELNVKRSPFLLPDAALRAYLGGVACKLGGEHCPDIRVYPVRTPFFNANMAPNGMLQIWSGLLLRIDNEAQLASVIGHELGHYLNRHTLDRWRDTRSRSALAMFSLGFGLAGAAVGLAAVGGGFAFSRDQEREADAIGLELMRRGGYDPREAAKLWAHLLDERHAAAPDADRGDDRSLFATHPSSAERTETLARLAERMSAGTSGGTLGTAEYAAAIAPFERLWLDDELQRGQYRETLALLDRKIAAAPQRADLRYYRAEAHRLLATPDDLRTAVDEAARAIALGDEPPAVHRTLGYALQRLEQADAARAAFSRYLALAPDAPDAALIRSYLESPPS